MANCCVCGTKLGLMESLNREIPEDTKSRGVCLKCHNYFLNDIFPPLKQAKKLHEVLEIKNNVLADANSKYGKDGCQYITDYFNYYLSKTFDFTEDTIVSCPVCLNDLIEESDKKICTSCGYVYQPQIRIPDNIKAERLNCRYQQYLKNPMFEYKVVKQRDGCIGGEVKADKLEKVLMNHALEGWKVHTIISNELGKNSIAGINATIDELVIVFERCIKGSEL